MISAVSGADRVPASPHKKRKMSMMATAAITKTKNALAERKAAEERAEKEAAEKAAQQASRKDRALSRQTSMTVSTRRSKVVHKVSSRRTVPVIKSTRKTNTVIKRGSATAPVSRATKPTGKLSGATAFFKRSLPSKGSFKKRARSPSPEAEPESDDNTPNITPSSLRSAAKKNLTQTTLPFKPLNFAKPYSSSKASPSKPSPAKKAKKGDFEVPDTDEDDEEDQFEDIDEDVDEEFNSGSKRPAKRAKKNTVGKGKGKAGAGAGGMKRTKSMGAGVKKTLNKSVRGTRQAAAGFAKKGGLVGVNEKAVKSTIRMVNGAGGVDGDGDVVMDE
jgi:palmitoyltransferase ZDHHC9/14/18